MVTACHVPYYYIAIVIMFLECVQALLEQQDTESLQGAGRSEEEEGDSLQWQRVAQLLGGKYDRIDPVQALPLLPLQVNYVRVATMPWLYR